MPFLRVLRDKRGYETTYLMDWVREGTRQRSRLLYVFRTPSGVRVGRSALDRDILREIEARFPDIEFNWDSVREQQHVIESAPPMRRRRPKRDEVDGGSEPLVEPAVAERSEPAAEARPSAPAPVPVVAIPSRLEGATPEEQTAFLARWYPVVMERVAARVTEPERRAAFAALAERLNPAGWSGDEIGSRLQQASDALERLSRVLVRRRRRSRRRHAANGQAPIGSASAPAADATAPPPAEDDGQESDEDGSTEEGPPYSDPT